MLLNVRAGFRSFLGSPGWTAVVVLTLALGIGASCAVFSVVSAVLLRPLPYGDPDRLVVIWQSNPSRDIEEDTVSPANYLDWRRQSRAFSDIAAVYLDPFSLTGGQEPERVLGGVASASLVPVLGVRPILGRAFRPDEESPGSRVVLLGEGLWRRRFGGDPGILQKPIRLNGESHMVIGVLPQSFDYPAKAELWVPLAFDAEEAASRGSRYLTVIGRLAPGRSLEQARSELQGIARSIAERYPKSVGWSVKLIHLQDEMVGEVRPIVLILLGAVGLVLLVACANVASLLLARIATRQREIAIRGVLGANRSGLITQVLTESLLLALIAGAVGTLLAVWGIKPLVALAGESIPRLSGVSVDLRVLSFAIVVSVLTALLFGLPPALQYSRPRLQEVLKESGTKATAGLGRQRLRSLLVVAEIATALILLIGASLLIRSFQRLQEVDLGFKPESILRVQVGLPESKYPEGVQQAAFFQEVLQRVSTLPGVKDVGAVTTSPLTASNLTYPFSILDGPQAATDPEDQILASYDAVSAGYFRAMGIPLLRGRAFTDHDRADAPGVVIINQTLARRYWPGESPIGRHIKIGDGGPNPREIVGIVQDVRHAGAGAEVREEIYVPFLQSPSPGMNLVVRSSSDPASLIPGVRAQVWSVDPEQPISRSDTMESLLASSISRPRFNMLLLSLFAGLALLLAIIGVYGLVSYTVAQRVNEIGIRMALGAQAQQIFRLVILQSMALVLTGVAIGLAAASAVTRILTRLLYQVSASDPMSFVFVALVLCAVALIATYVPARRAMLVDPAVALRS